MGDKSPKSIERKSKQKQAKLNKNKRKQESVADLLVPKAASKKK